MRAKQVIAALCGVLIAVTLASGPRLAAQDVRRSLTNLTNAMAKLADGTAAAPSLAFVNNPDMGFYRASNNNIGVTIAGVQQFAFGNASQLLLLSNTASLTFGAANDTNLIRQSAGNLTIGGGSAAWAIGTSGIVDQGVHNVTVGGTVVNQDANGSTWTRGQLSELLTLSIAGTTTDTVGNLLPANAIIESVVARVTTTITVATDWKLGDATIAGRFAAANATMTSGATSVGTVQADQTGTSGPRQVSAAKVRVTTTGTPGAGVIRITVFYRAFVAPTS